MVNERMMIAMAMFLYAMAIIEVNGKSDSFRDRLIPAIYMLVAFGLSVVWVIST